MSQSMMSSISTSQVTCVLVDAWVSAIAFTPPMKIGEGITYRITPSNSTSHLPSR